MKIIELILGDGTRTMASAPVPDDFDVQSWANRRQASLYMLGVVKVVETFLQESTHETPIA